MNPRACHLGLEMFRYLAEPALRAFGLAALAGLALRLGRVKDSAVRLAVGTAVPYAALAMPFLAGVAPTVRLPLPPLSAASAVPPLEPAEQRIVAARSLGRAVARAASSALHGSIEPGGSRWTFSWPLIAAVLYVLP